MLVHKPYIDFSFPRDWVRLAFSPIRLQLEHFSCGLDPSIVALSHRKLVFHHLFQVQWHPVHSKYVRLKWILNDTTKSFWIDASQLAPLANQKTASKHNFKVVFYLLTYSFLLPFFRKNKVWSWQNFTKIKSIIIFIRYWVKLKK